MARRDHCFRVEALFRQIQGCQRGPRPVRVCERSLRWTYGQCNLSCRSLPRVPQIFRQTDNPVCRFVPRHACRGREGGSGAYNNAESNGASSRTLFPDAPTDGRTEPRPCFAAEVTLTPPTLHTPFHAIHGAGRRFRGRTKAFWQLI